MKNTPHKVIIAIIIGLLSVQTFFPSLSSLLLPEIHAIDHTIEPLDETHNMSLLDKATQPIQTKEFDIHTPFFQFPVSVIEGVVDYGFMNFTNMSIPQQNLSRMRYHNLTNAGNQLIHSHATPVVMSGEVTSHQSPTYTSRSGRVQTINATNQVNMEITQLEVLDNAVVDMSTINAGNIYLYYATGRMIIGDDVKMTLRTAGTGGEAYGANIYIQNGRIDIGNRSELHLNARANSPAISIGALIKCFIYYAKIRMEGWQYE